MTTTTTHHVPAGGGHSHPMIDGDHVAKVAVTDTEGAFELFEIVAPAAPMAPPHVSPWSGAMYLLSGRITAHVGDASYDVGPGDVVVFPAGTPGTFEVVGEEARFVAVTTGERAGKFFADFSGSVPADRPVEESLGEILSVTARHGVSIAGA